MRKCSLSIVAVGTALTVMLGGCSGIGQLMPAQQEQPHRFSDDIASSDNHPDFSVLGNAVGIQHLLNTCRSRLSLCLQNHL